MPLISVAPRFCAILLAVLVSPIAPCATPAVARWAGRYVDERFNQVMDIDTQGRVHTSGAMFLGGDAGLRFQAEGVLRAEGQWLTLTLQPKESLEFPGELLKPQRFLPRVSEGRRFLLDERGLVGIVNNVNLKGERRVEASFGAHELFPSEEYSRPQVQVDADSVLPPEYRARLLSRPLHGHVTRVVASVAPEPVRGGSSFAVGPPRAGPAGPRPPLRRTTLELDLGSADGVFVGMILCVSDTYDQYFWVDGVESHRSTATATTAMKFAAGDAVGSRPLRGAR